MGLITRRNFVKGAAAGLAAPALVRGAPSPPSRSRSASSISGRSATTAGPGRTRRAARRWSTRFKGQVVADYVENVKEDASAMPILKDLAQQGHKLIFATSFGYMDQTRRSRQAVPGREVRALHRLQARRQPRHLQLPLPSGPRGRGHDRRPDVEVGRRSAISAPTRCRKSCMGVNAFTLAAQAHEPEDHHQARHDRFVVRPGQGSRGGPDAHQPRLRRHRPAHRQSRPACRSASSARSGASATPPTCRASRRRRSSPRSRTSGAPTTSRAPRRCSTGPGSRTTPGGA